MTTPASTPTPLPIPDAKYLQGIEKRQYVTKQEVMRCLGRQDQLYRAGNKKISLMDVLLEQGFLSRSQAERIRHDVEEGRSFNLHVPGFRILSRIGEGGMGVVYRARQGSLHRDVALKVLRDHLSKDTAFLERFLREAITTAQINHPHVVGVVDVGMDADGKSSDPKGSTEGKRYIALEFIDGIDLSVEMQQRARKAEQALNAQGKKVPPQELPLLGRFEELETAKLGLDIARALAHLHRVGYIHRDVKPQNIMITRDGIAKLTDMGLARRIGDQEMIVKEKGKALGTPDYISPEAIRGEPNLDGRADQYCLGGTLYHLVVGRVPFVADTPVKVMGKHMEEALVPASRLRPELRLGLSEVIEVLLSKSRRARYEKSEDMVLDLEAIVAGHTPVIAFGKLGRPIPAQERINIDDPALEPGGEPEHQPEPTAEPEPPPTPTAPAAAAKASAGGWVWLLIVISILANVALAAVLASKMSAGS